MNYDEVYLVPFFVRNLSFIVVSPDEKVLALVPLYLCRIGESFEFSYGGGALQGPILELNLLSDVQRQVEQMIIGRINELASLYDVSLHRFIESRFEISHSLEFDHFCYKYGYSVNELETLVIDLRLSIENTWQNLRKSYKSLINKTKKTYYCQTLDKINFDFQLCESYRQLHKLAAGRETRSVDSFYSMYNMIRQDEAFLILVRDETGVVRGSYFYNRFNKKVFYSSAATHPDLSSSSGVGHFGMWEAIRYAKGRGDIYFELGYRPVECNLITNQKEQNIAFFKSGFGGEYLKCYEAIKMF